AQLDGGAPLRLVAPQVVLGNQAPPLAALHLGDDQVGNLTAIEDIRAGVADELERPREVRLSPHRSRRRCAVVYEELRPAGRELREQLAIGSDIAAAGRVDDVALREVKRWGDHCRPGEGTVPFPFRIESRDA